MGYRDYFEFSAANMARIEEQRLYREALNLEPSVGPGLQGQGDLYTQPPRRPPGLH